MTTEQAQTLIPEKSQVIYGKSKFTVKGLFYPIVDMPTHIEIYDEWPSMHIDRVLISSCKLVDPEEKESQVTIKKIPREIFLCLGDDLQGEINFEDLKEVSWSCSKEFKDDPKYILASPIFSTPADHDDLILRRFDSNKYYWCKCSNCGWEDSSDHTEGCHQIADTGDYTDPLCPICFSNSLDEESEINPPQHEGEVTIKIPVEIHINAYKKALNQANETIENIRYPITKAHKEIEDSAFNSLKLLDGEAIGYNGKKYIESQKVVLIMETFAKYNHSVEKYYRDKFASELKNE